MIRLGLESVDDVSQGFAVKTNFIILDDNVGFSHGDEAAFQALAMDRAGGVTIAFSASVSLNLDGITKVKQSRGYFELF